MPLLDRIWPSRQVRRAAERVARKRSFEAAMPAGWRGIQTFGCLGPETLAAAGPIRTRARHAAANNPYIANAVSAVVGEAVGAGIEAVSAHPDPDQRAALDAAFNAYAEMADAEGRTDLRGLIAQVTRACMIDGEAFILFEGERLRLIPAEMVDEPLTRELPNGGYIVAGIEFDGAGQRVAYHVLPHRPTDHFPTASTPIRVPASDMLHLMRPLGPGQVRGGSWLAPVLLTANEFDQLTDAMLFAQKIAAMFAGFVIDQNNLAGGSGFPDEDISLEPGTIRRLAAGEDIRFATPDQASDGVAFAKLTLGQIAAGLGIPQHLLDGDLSSANYSSLRAGLLPFRQKIEQFQYHCRVAHFCGPD